MNSIVTSKVRITVIQFLLEPVEVFGFRLSLLRGLLDSFLLTDLLGLGGNLQVSRSIGAEEINSLHLTLSLPMYIVSTNLLVVTHDLLNIRLLKVIEVPLHSVSNRLSGSTQLLSKILANLTLGIFLTNLLQQLQDFTVILCGIEGSRSWGSRIILTAAVRLFGVRTIARAVFGTVLGTFVGGLGSGSFYFMLSHLL